MCLKVESDQTSYFVNRVYYKIFELLENNLVPCFRWVVEGHTYYPGENEAILNGKATEEGFHCFYHEKDAEEFRKLVIIKNNGKRVILPVYCNSEDFLKSGYTDYTGILDGLACATFKKITIKQEDYEKHIEVNYVS